MQHWSIATSSVTVTVPVTSHFCWLFSAGASVVHSPVWNAIEHLWYLLIRVQCDHTRWYKGNRPQNRTYHDFTKEFPGTSTSFWFRISAYYSSKHCVHCMVYLTINLADSTLIPSRARLAAVHRFDPQRSVLISFPFAVCCVRISAPLHPCAQTDSVFIQNKKLWL